MRHVLLEKKCNALVVSGLWEVEISGIDLVWRASR